MQFLQFGGVSKCTSKTNSHLPGGLPHSTPSPSKLVELLPFGAMCAQALPNGNQAGWQSDEEKRLMFTRAFKNTKKYYLDKDTYPQLIELDIVLVNSISACHTGVQFLPDVDTFGNPLGGLI